MNRKEHRKVLLGDDKPIAEGALQFFDFGTVLPLQCFDFGIVQLASISDELVRSICVTSTEATTLLALGHDHRRCSFFILVRHLQLVLGY